MRKLTVAFAGGRWVVLNSREQVVAEAGSGERSHQWVTNYVRIRQPRLASDKAR